MSHWIETRTGWTIKRIVQALRPYRQVTINTGTQQITAEQPVPDDIRRILAKIHQLPGD